MSSEVKNCLQTAFLKKVDGTMIQNIPSCVPWVMESTTGLVVNVATSDCRDFPRTKFNLGA